MRFSSIKDSSLGDNNENTIDLDFRSYEKVKAMNNGNPYSSFALKKLQKEYYLLK